MSFFVNETICPDCLRKEEEIREKIRKELGADGDLDYRGCGFIPDVSGDQKRTPDRLPDKHVSE